MGEDDNLEAFGDLIYTVGQAFRKFGWYNQIISNSRVKSIFENRKVRAASGKAEIVSEVKIVERMFKLKWVIDDEIEGNYLYLGDSLYKEKCRIGATSNLVIDHFELIKSMKEVKK